MADEGSGSGDDCGGTCGSNNARKKARKMNCAELLAKINELVNTEKRGRMGTKGLMQRFRDYLGDDATHGPTYYDQQRSLRSYMDEYEDKGCGGPPPNALEWVDKKLPAPAPAPEEGLSTTQKVVAGAGAVGAGYLIYRGIRMIPSLFPALWWTAPANLAAP